MLGVMDEELLTASQAGEALSASSQTIRNWIRSDRLHAAVGGAAIATLAAAVARAPYPAQFVTSSAAGCAFLALLIRPGRPSSSDWFKVRVLLATNLVVFGVSYAHELSLALAATAVAPGVLLLAVTVRAHLLNRGGRRSKR
jgi:hypothetical protein